MPCPSSSPQDVAPIPSRAPRLQRLLCALLALFCAELLLRRVCYVPRALDPDFGFVPEAGREARWAIEGDGRAHYGPRGVRSTPGSAPAPADAPAVLVIGDSFTESHHVDDDETFAARAQALLVAAGQPARLLNVGVAGQRTPGYVELAPRYRAAFRPAWSVVVLNEDDLLADMYDPSATYFTGGRGGQPLRLHTVSAATGDSALRGLWRRAKAKSALLQRGGLQLVGFLGDARGARLFRSAAPPPPAAPPRAADYPVRLALELLLRAYQGRVTLVLLPRFRPGGAHQPSDVEQIFQDVCALRSCVHLGPAFSSFAARRATPYGFPNRGFNVGHLNHAGHGAVAAALAGELLRLRSHGIF